MLNYQHTVNLTKINSYFDCTTFDFYIFFNPIQFFQSSQKLANIFFYHFQRAPSFSDSCYWYAAFFDYLEFK